MLGGEDLWLCRFENPLVEDTKIHSQAPRTSRDRRTPKIFILAVPKKKSDGLSC